MTKLYQNSLCSFSNTSINNLFKTSSSLDCISPIPIMLSQSHTSYSNQESEEIKRIVMETSERTKFCSQYLTKIKELSILNNGWDSYEAPPPNKAAVKSAEIILESLSSLRLHPAKIMPSVEGGIFFLFTKGNRYADLECDNDGDIIAGISDRKNEPEIWEVNKRKYSDINSIDSSLERINDFLNI